MQSELQKYLKSKLKQYGIMMVFNQKYPTCSLPAEKFVIINTHLDKKLINYAIAHELGHCLAFNNYRNKSERAADYEAYKVLKGFFSDEKAIIRTSSLEKINN